jgi:hypothetical protein
MNYIKWYITLHLKMIIINGIQHKSQKACEEYIRSRLSVIGITNCLSLSSPSDVPYFYELCKRHPTADDKLRYFSDFAMRYDLLNKKAIALDIINTDGSVTEISWKKCVTGRAETIKSLFCSALRHSISNQISDFRASTNITICEICNESLLDNPFHVDHIVHFAKLVDDFLVEYKGSFDIPVYYDKQARTYLTTFRDEDKMISDLFQEYHFRHASLRLLCVKCNLTREKHPRQ